MTQFWILTLASATSKMGNTFLRLAVPIVIFQSTGSPTAAIATVAIENLPNLAGPWLGALVDRFPRRTVFAVSELSQAAVVAILPILLHNSWIVAIYGCLLLLGTGSVISNLTSEFSLIPSLANPGRVGRAYAQYNFAVESARFIGPFIGGVLMVAVTVDFALWVDAATFVLTATVVWQLRVGLEALVPELGLIASFKAGWSHFVKLPEIRRLTVSLTVYNLGVGAIATVLIAIGASTWSWSPVVTGFVISAGAIASAVGSALGDRLATAWSWRRRIGFWMAISAASSLLLIPASPILAATAFVLMSFAAGPMNVATMALRHEQIDPAYIGRVNAIVRAFIMGAIPVSALLLGATSAAALHILIFAPVVIGSVLAVVSWVVRFTRSGRSVELAGPREQDA